MRDHDPTDIREQERAAADARQRAKLERDSEEDDLKWLMRSRRGRRIIWRHLVRARVFRSSFDTDALVMAFSEGIRNDGLRTMTMIHQLCPELYPTMIVENKDVRPANDEPGTGA